MPFLFFFLQRCRSFLLKNWLVKYFTIMSLQDPHSTPHICVLTELHTLTMVHHGQLRSIPLLQSSEQQSKLAMQRFSRCYGRHRVVALRCLLNIIVEEEIGSGSFQSSLAKPETSPQSSQRFWTFTAEFVVSLPSKVASGSFIRLRNLLPVSKFAKYVLQLALPYKAESVFSPRKIMIVVCGPSSTIAIFPRLLVMARLFAEKSWSSFFFHAATFLSSSILRHFQELCRSTTRAGGMKGYPCTSCSRYCQQVSSLPAVEIDFLITAIFISKFSPGGTF